MPPFKFWTTDAHDLEAANYRSLVLVIVVLVSISSTIIIFIFCCSVAHALTHRHIYHMQRLDTHHATSKKSSTARETASLRTVNCLVSTKTKGSRLCTTTIVTKVSSNENNPNSNPNEVRCDGTKSTAVDLISIARNSRLLYAVPEEKSNACADEVSPSSSESSTIEDDVFVDNGRHGQRLFHLENLNDVSNDYSNTNHAELSEQHTTESNTEHQHIPSQHYIPWRPQQTGNMSNVVPANTKSSNRYSNSTCSIHSNSVQSINIQNKRPASLDWKAFYQQSSDCTKNWYSETLVADSTPEQTEKPRQPMRICLAEVGIARLFPFCDSDKAKMPVIAKQTIKCKITNQGLQNELSVI